MGLLKIIKNFAGNFFKISISLTIIIFVLVPIFIIILLPIYTYRYCISKWSNLFIPSHGKILSTLSNIFAVDDMTIDPTCSIVLTLSLEQQLPVEEVKRRVRDLLNTGKYPELQQNLTKWMGFFFWKWSSSFCLDDHVMSIDNPMGDDDIQKLKETLLKQPYTKDKSLWNMTIVTNYTGSQLNAKSICFNRFHHCLVDGFSLYKLNSQLSDCPDQWIQAVQKRSLDGKFRKFLIHLNLIAFGPYELACSMHTTYEKNEWKLKPGSAAKDGVFGETNKVSLAELKSIAKIQGVSISALLFASYTGAMRRMMMKYGKRQLPQKVTLVCPFPMPGHPNKLRIHVAIAPITAPVGISDPILRLQLLQKQFDQLKTSTLPLTYYYSVKFFGALFPWMIKLLTAGTGLGTGIVSNFPGPNNQVDLFGYKLTGLSVLAGIAHGSHCAGSAFVSYNGLMSIAAGFDKALFSEKERAEEFSSYILNEFEIFKEGKKVDSVMLSMV